MKILRGLVYLYCRVSLRELSLEKRKLQGDLRAPSSTLRGSKRAEEGILKRTSGDRTSMIVLN